MLREETLFGRRDLVELALERLRAFEKQACDMHPDGYWVAFSGGKDSIVILDLVRKAGVKHTAHFNVTTVDPPELLAFMRQHYPDVRRERPRFSMWQLIEKNMMPPTRNKRFCCGELKEQRGGTGRFVVTGVRWAESVRRMKRRMTETCLRDRRKRFLHPIIEWSNDDVWQYIRENRMPYCRLYDEGWTRIGCVGCPMAGDARKKHFARWPHFEAQYRKAFARAAAARAEAVRKGTVPASPPHVVRWDSGDAIWDWWINEPRAPEDEDSDQLMLFE
jgi:phosphoadenosine phosphosulfate reductase